MKRSILTIAFLLLCGFGLIAQETATLSSQIYGYKRDMVYYDCQQSPFIRQEFHTNPGEDHTYSFPTKSLVSLSVNAGAVDFILQPKDSLNAVIKYEGKVIQSLTLSGTPGAVAANNLMWNIEMFKRSIRYRSQLLGCAALDVKPKDRIRDSKILLDRVNDMLGKAGNSITAEAKNYILSVIEGVAYESYMEYPVMYSEIRKLSIDKQEIGDYWSLMDGISFRDDDASLASIEYVSMLMRFCAYSKALEAHKKGIEYVAPNTFEDIFKEVTTFFNGKQRDAVAFMLISNFIMNGQDIQRVDPVLKEYKEKFNINPEYINILETLLQ